MKHSWLLVLMLLGIILMGASPAGAASGVGPYYTTPSWDQTMPASTRFVVLTNFNNEAVLDRETGLVWEQEISATTFTWTEAMSHCFFIHTGGKYGWRLPFIEELASLREYSSGVYPPAVFTSSTPNPTFDMLWSGTQYPTTTELTGYAVRMGSGLPGAPSPDTRLYAWCVRGPR